MRINHLSLHNYRNYTQLNLSFHNDLNIFLGENAQGKTNVIEAIYYAAMGQSHRSNNDRDLIHWSEQAASLQITFERLQVSNNIRLNFFTERKKEMLLNGQKVKTKELLGAINVILFSPEDLFLIKGAPVGRRRFLDLELSQASPTYYDHLLRYNRILAQRNMLLKRIKDRKATVDLLDTWDSQLASLAVDIVVKRLAAVKKLNMLAKLMQRKITNNRENLDIAYELAGADNDIHENLNSWYNDRLGENRLIDIARGSTSIGPHRDDLTITVNKINLRTFGSQGQQRTGILALKLAELEFLKSETGEYPILLLDDVMSELDVSRREQLLGFIKKEKIQTFITATDQAYFPKKDFGKYYNVVSGVVRE